MKKVMIFQFLHGMPCKFLVFIISFFLFSCLSSSKDEDIQRSRIANVLQKIEESFRQANWDTIMDNYHPDFIHNGRNYHTQRIVWRERTALYNRLEIEVISIEILEDYAMAKLILYYYDMTTQHGPFIEPEYIGDMSFFYYDKGQWLIYGNQDRD